MCIFGKATSGVFDIVTTKTTLLQGHLHKKKDFKVRDFLGRGGGGRMLTKREKQRFLIP